MTPDTRHLQAILDRAPQVIEENLDLATRIIELVREATALEHEIERLRSQVPTTT